MRFLFVRTEIDSHKCPRIDFPGAVHILIPPVGSLSQVTIGLVASKEGLPLAFEVFDGNRSDVTTVEEMVELMEKKYGAAERVWVMDRGMVSEKNLAFMRKRRAWYLVGTPKALLRKFEQELLEKNWKSVRPDVEIKLCPSPDGSEETYVLCRSQGRKEKELAILNRFITRIEEGLQKIQEQAATGKVRDKQKVLLRIGKLLGKNSRAASLYGVTVDEIGSGKAMRLTITVTKNEERYNWALATSASYSRVREMAICTSKRQLYHADELA